MADKYANFAALVSSEPSDAYSKSSRDVGSRVAVAAPHGGGIEPGTSEVALAIAGTDLSYYLFEGRKAEGNRDLHVTSTNFDDPECLALLRAAETVIAVHGEGGGEAVVYLGGRDDRLRGRIAAELGRRNFEVRTHANSELQGRHPRNVCNVGRSGAGVQLELSRGLRETIFRSLSAAGRGAATPRLSDFASAVRSATLERAGAYVGIDVQSSRRCPYAVLDGDLEPVDSGWLDSPGEILPVVRRAAESLGRVAVGVDAPRTALSAPRTHFWSGGRWRARRASEGGRGRHCEVALAALRIATPQWTPLAADAPAWMRTGFELFACLAREAKSCDAYEVFPSASYRLLEGDPDARLRLRLCDLLAGPKDMLDAYVAAFTVHEYLVGRGAAVGGGDGLGAIVLPRPVAAGANSAVLRWPG